MFPNRLNELIVVATGGSRDGLFFIKKISESLGKLGTTLGSKGVENQSNEGSSNSESV